MITSPAAVNHRAPLTANRPALTIGSLVGQGERLFERYAVDPDSAEADVGLVVQRPVGEGARPVA